MDDPISGSGQRWIPVLVEKMGNDPIGQRWIPVPAGGTREQIR